ncbi:hypothetical protein KFK09_028339 [Dendrobium nobile]|uniref:Uncharacterized protein n=1 Tax=Dendrobium nobile TaxID=94219 RepID=A0A8T3A1C1_DENNO|nr:hypothetical protein KFK09_028339 [Dendrobium nobile]
MKCGPTPKKGVVFFQQPTCGLLCHLQMIRPQVLSSISKVYFSPKNQCYQCGYGFMHKHLPLKYLGTPLVKGKKRSHLFVDIFFNIQKKLTTWAFNFLSFSGRFMLIKSVLSSISIYLF